MLLGDLTRRFPRLQERKDVRARHVRSDIRSDVRRSAANGLEWSVITAAPGGGGLIATAAAFNLARRACEQPVEEQPSASRWHPFLHFISYYHYDAQGNAGKGPVPEAR